MPSSVFIVAESYAPGFRAGGPVRSVANLVDWLGDEFDFHIFTRDRDIGDIQPYPGVACDVWSETPGARVFYASPRNFPRALPAAVRTCCPRLVYLNSLFAAGARRALLTRRFDFSAKFPVLLAPRGELQVGALAQKPLKKELYLTGARATGLLRSVRFHATASSEASDLQRAFGPNTPVRVVPNLGLRRPIRAVVPVRKESGAVSFVFFSRVVPKKNLSFLVDLLRSVGGRVDLVVYGPVEDTAYARAVDALVEQLPAGMTFRWAGALSPDEISPALSRHHFFALPTLGENYGHAIVDAWAAGLPVLLSDRTPWRGLAELGLGWDMPLSDRDAWIGILRHCVEMVDVDYQRLRASAFAHAAQILSTPPLEEWRRLFAWAASPL